MNLENLNLVELNAQEVEHTEGGCWDCVPGGRYIKAGIDAVGDFFSGFADGWNAIN